MGVILPKHFQLINLPFYSLILLVVEQTIEHLAERLLRHSNILVQLIEKAREQVLIRLVQAGATT